MFASSILHDIILFNIENYDKFIQSLTQQRINLIIHEERMIIIRNPNGYGTVCKLSGNRYKPWMAKVPDGVTKQGYIKYAPLGYYKTQQEANIELAKYNDNPYNLDAKNATFEDIYKIFMERMEKKNKDNESVSWRSVYKSAFSRAPRLHAKKIKETKTYTLQAIIDGIELEWQSKSHTLTLMGCLYEIAMELDICNKNYAKFVDIGSKPESVLRKPFVKNEIDIISKNLNIDIMADTLLIMIYSGLRIQELLKIEKANVYLDEKYIIGGIKTRAGKERIIPIHDKILPLIIKRYNSSNKHLIEARGSSITYRGYRRHWDKCMETLNMEHLPHDCRHTFASLMDSAGANRLATKQIMGHKSQDITDGIYTHKQIEELLYNVNLI